MWSSIIKIFEYITGWMFNKSNNTILSDNENARKLQDQKDENRKLIDKAQTDDSAFEELQKKASK